MDLQDLAAELVHERTIVNWFKYKTREVIPGVYRQNKNILRKICTSLPNMGTVNDNDTKDVLVNRLKRYMFSEEEKEALQKYRELEVRLKNLESRKRLFETITNGERPYTQFDQWRLDYINEEATNLQEDYDKLNST